MSQQLRQHALLGLHAILEAALREEVADYRDRLRPAARAAGRTPSRLRCAGQYHRRVLTTYGLIPDLRVPKLRSSNAELPWQILSRYQLAMQAVLDHALYLYTLGRSIRDLQEALYLAFGQVLSRALVIGMHIGQRRKQLEPTQEDVRKRMEHESIYVSRSRFSRIET